VVIAFYALDYALNSYSDYLQGVGFETFSIILLDGVLAEHWLGCRAFTEC
jgi:hypothetical protein